MHHKVSYSNCINEGVICKVLDNPCLEFLIIKIFRLLDIQLQRNEGWTVVKRLYELRIAHIM